MKTILLPEPLLELFNISKVNWPKVLCIVSYIKRYPNGRISYEYFRFNFRGTLYHVVRFYDKKGRCNVENVGVCNYFNDLVVL